MVKTMEDQSFSPSLISVKIFKILFKRSYDDPDRLLNKSDGGDRSSRNDSFLFGRL